MGSKQLINSLIDKIDSSQVLPITIVPSQSDNAKEKLSKKGTMKEEEIPQQSILKEIDDINKNINSLHETYNSYNSQIDNMINKTKYEENVEKKNENNENKLNNNNSKDKYGYLKKKSKSGEVQSLNFEEIEIDTRVKKDKTPRNTKEKERSSNNFSDKNSNTEHNSTSSKSSRLKKKPTKPYISKQYDSDYALPEEDDTNDEILRYNKDSDIEPRNSHFSARRKDRIDSVREVRSFDVKPPKLKSAKDKEYNLNIEPISSRKPKNDYIANEDTIFSYKPKYKK